MKRPKTPLLERVPQALALALCVLLTSTAWKADEIVIRGQVHGLERAEGVWVGLDKGKHTLSHYQHAPFDNVFIEQERNKVEDWVFAPVGEFELRSELEESANLILVSKNRVPILIPITPGASVPPIENHMLRGMELEGLILDSKGIPISGATVSIRPNGKGYEIPSFAIPSWVTGANGTFRMAGLEPREYLLIVSADQYAPIVVPYFVIPDTNVQRLEVELADGHYVSGQVIDENGTPIPDVSINSSWIRSHAEVLESDGVIRVNRQKRFGRYFPRTQTSEEGTFRLGPFELATSGTIFARSLKLGTSAARDVYAPSDELVLRLLREKIQGRVLDADTDSPIQEISVVLYGAAGGKDDVQTMDGYFELPVGPVDSEATAVLIDARGYSPWVGRLFQGSTGIYDLGRLSLERERTLKGIVRDGATGEAMDGVPVQRNAAQYVDRYIDVLMRNWLQRHRSTTNEDGEFLLKKLPRAADRLELLVRGHGWMTVDVPSEVEEFDIDLYFDSVLEGSLVLPDGRSVEGVVELRGPSVVSPTAHTNAGTFRFEELSPGRYWLTGETEEGLVRGRAVYLEAGERLMDVKLKVTPGWSAEGKITGLKGDESVRLSVKKSEGRELIRKYFRNGPYAVHGVPNEALITARTSTGLLLTRRFDNRNEEGGPIDFHFDSESQLRGFVLVGGQPVQGIKLFIVPKNLDYVAGYTTTSASGGYVFKGLSNGPHVLRTPMGYSHEIVIDGKTVSDIELPQNAVSGIVRSERTRMPIGGGVVTISGMDVPVARGSAVGIKRIGSDGTFLFEGLIAGEYEVEVVHPHAEKALSRVTVDGLQTIEISIQCANTQECMYGESGPRRTVKSQ